MSAIRNLNFESWLSGGSTTVNVDVKIGDEIVRQVMGFLKDRTAVYLESVKKYKEEIGKADL